MFEFFSYLNYVTVRNCLFRIAGLGIIYGKTQQSHNIKI